MDRTRAALETRFAGCLLGAMVGDSLGSRFEGIAPGIIRHRYGGAKGLLGLAPERYTCVSEMMAAVASSLATHPDFDGEDMARRLLDFEGAGRRYGQGTSMALARLRSGCPWNEAGSALSGRGCYGNAAAARAVPVGLLDASDADWLRWVAEESAGITHQHSFGAEGAVLIAFGVALAVAAEPGGFGAAAFLQKLARECQVREFRSRIDSALLLLEREREAETIVSRLGNNSTALGSVVTALYCFAEDSESFTGALSRALSLGGNASAIASMTGALSGAYLGIEALPARWIEGLEQGQVSAAGLRELASRLAVLSKPA